MEVVRSVAPLLHFFIIDHGQNSADTVVWKGVKDPLMKCNKVATHFALLVHLGTSMACIFHKWGDDFWDLQENYLNWSLTYNVSQYLKAWLIDGTVPCIINMGGMADGYCFVFLKDTLSY